MDAAYLKLLAAQFPTEDQALSELVRLKALQGLPKGTELYLSDVHGEDEAFTHILNNASGVIYEKICTALPQMGEAERRALASLVYYPREQLARIDEKQEGERLRQVLLQLIAVAKACASKYTGRSVRAAMPDTSSYHSEELMSDHDQENRARYVASILVAVSQAGRLKQLAEDICALIKRLAVARLHLVGDIYDRGPHPDVIMDGLMSYHSVDIEWGNHDLLWMGAAAGSPACVAGAVRNCIQYNNLDMLENSYGISLLPLAIFASREYADDAAAFAPRNPPRALYLPEDPKLYARMHKAIWVIQQKLEGQLVLRRPEYGMQDRAMLSRVNWQEGTLELQGKAHPLRDRAFPTVDPADPLKLSDQEYALIGQLVDAFRRSFRLQRHVRFLYERGDVYLRHNGMLLYHGCIPVEEDGSFKAFRFDGQELSGRALLDYCGRMARQGYFAPENSRERKAGRDFLWFLWCGRDAPSFGRSHMTGFERTLIADEHSWKEPRNAYYRWYQDEAFVLRLLHHFECDQPWSRIINGHVPVKAAAGEDPRKAGGRLIVIDGGFCEAYQHTTGIAGYTMFFSSHGIRIAAHEPFTSRAEAIAGRMDIRSHSLIIENLPRRLLIKDTDEGAEIAGLIEALGVLIEAYRLGTVREQGTAGPGN